MLQRLQFFGSVLSIYIATIGTLGVILYASHLFGTPVWASSPSAVTTTPIKLPPKVISGIPRRIAIASAGISLPINNGTYDESTGGWTLTDTEAQFATMTAPANDHRGTTFIYGHGTDAVFGKIGTTPPPAGTMAEITTDNGRIFRYELKEVRDFTPEDVSMLSDTASGSPRLVVQTCTGAFSQWRTMFIFDFKEIVS